MNTKPLRAAASLMRENMMNERHRLDARGHTKLHVTTTDGHYAHIHNQTPETLGMKSHEELISKAGKQSMIIVYR